MICAIGNLANLPDAILTFSQPFTSIASQLARRFGLRGADPESVEIGRDKRLTREQLRKHQVDNTKFRVCSASDLEEAAASVRSHACGVTV
jgi:carbamoylphosphate synthase large subunit